MCGSVVTYRFWFCHCLLFFVGACVRLYSPHGAFSPLVGVVVVDFYFSRSKTSILSV